MVKVPVRTMQSTTESIMFIPQQKLPLRIANATLIDSILRPNEPFVHISNDTDTPIKLHASDVIGAMTDNHYYDQTPPIDRAQVDAFFNLVNPILKKKEFEEFKPEEQQYQDKQPNLTYGLKLAEILDYEEVTTKELLSSLDFNPKLSNSQKKALEQVIFKNRKAFSLDG